MTVCNRCGKENQDHYKFCLGCGAELTAAPKPGGDMAMMKTMMADQGASPAGGAPPGKIRGPKGPEGPMGAPQGPTNGNPMGPPNGGGGMGTPMRQGESWKPSRKPRCGPRWACGPRCNALGCR